MGYSTYVYGEVTFSDVSFLKMFELMVDEKFDILKDFDKEQDFVFEFEENTLSIQMDYKNYDNDFENLCYLIANLDKKANGVIDCNGEERDDNWKIEIKNGIVNVYDSKIKYFIEQENYQNERIKNEFNELLKNKTFERKLILKTLNNDSKDK